MPSPSKDPQGPGRTKSRAVLLPLAGSPLLDVRSSLHNATLCLPRDAVGSAGFKCASLDRGQGITVIVVEPLEIKPGSFSVKLGVYSSVTPPTPYSLEDLEIEVWRVTSDPFEPINPDPQDNGAALLFRGLVPGANYIFHLNDGGDIKLDRPPQTAPPRRLREAVSPIPRGGELCLPTRSSMAEAGVLTGAGTDLRRGS